MIEADDFQAFFPRLPLHPHQLLRRNVITIVRRIGPRVAAAHGFARDPSLIVWMTEKHAAALVRIRFLAVAADRIVFEFAHLQHRLRDLMEEQALRTCRKFIRSLESHRFLYSSHSLSLKYLSAESHSTVTITASS